MISWRKTSEIFLKLLTILVAVIMLNACSSDPLIEEVDTDDKSCLSCIILNKIYTSVGDNVMLMHSQLTQAAMPIMMVAFSVWLALRLLKFVSSVTETNPGEVWNEILRKAALCLFCGILASSSQGLIYVINTFVFPIYAAFLELGIDILNVSFTAKDQTDFTVFGTEVVVEGVKMSCSIDGTPFVNAKGFPSAVGDAMNCMVKILSAYLTIGGDIAITIMRQSEVRLTGKIMAIILFLFFWVVKIGFSFYLVDTIFQMGIIILLLPIYIISYAFGPTRAWTKKGFGHILASSAFMMCFSIIVATVLSAMIGLVEQNKEIFDPEDLEGYMQDINLGFLCLLLIGFLIYGSMGVSQQLTSALLGTGLSANFQKNLKAAVQGIGEGILKGLSYVGSMGISAMATSNVRFLKFIGKNIERGSAIRAKMHQWAGRK